LSKGKAARQTTIGSQSRALHRTACMGGRVVHASDVRAVPRTQHVDPWNVSGGADGKIDYNKLVEQVRAVAG
jgi:hypothetical protein